MRVLTAVLRIVLTMIEAWWRGQLLERRRAAGALSVIDDIRVVPLLELQKLHHLRSHTDSPLDAGRQHIVTSDLRQISA